MNVTVTITGTQEQLDKLKKLDTGLTDFSSAFNRIGDRVTKYFAGEAYASQGGVFNAVWAPLSPAYAQRKAIGNTKRPPIGKGAYPGRGILEASGEMRKSFKYESATGGVSITNTAPQAIYHQSTEPRTKMPYRPIMLINDGVRDIVREELTDDIARKIENL